MGGPSPRRIFPTSGEREVMIGSSPDYSTSELLESGPGLERHLSERWTPRWTLPKQPAILDSIRLRYSWLWAPTKRYFDAAGGYEGLATAN